MAQTAIFVLGMHRSGMSPLARPLNLIGVDRGPADRFDPSSPWNPTGYWEHTELRDINEDLLVRSAATSAIRLPCPYRRRIATATGPQVACRRDHPARLRRCRYLGIQSPHLHDARTADACIMCVRDPLGVADSLLHSSAPANNGFDREQGVAMWTRCVAASVAGSKGHARTVVWYDDVLRDPAGELSRLACEIGLGTADLSPKTLGAADASVQPELRHHRPRKEDDEAGLPADTRDVLTALRARDGDWAKLDRLADRLLRGQGAAGE